MYAVKNVCVENRLTIGRRESRMAVTEWPPLATPSLSRPLDDMSKSEVRDNGVSTYFYF